MCWKKKRKEKLEKIKQNVEDLLDADDGHVLRQTTLVAGLAQVVVDFARTEDQLEKDTKTNETSTIQSTRTAKHLKEKKQKKIRDLLDGAGVLGGGTLLADDALELRSLDHVVETRLGLRVAQQTETNTNKETNEKFLTSNSKSFFFRFGFHHVGPSRAQLKPKCV